MLFLVRVAQGLVHMGKGLLTLNPYHTDGQLLSGGCASLCQLGPSRDLLLCWHLAARQVQVTVRLGLDACCHAGQPPGTLQSTSEAG